VGICLVTAFLRSQHSISIRLRSGKDLCNIFFFFFLSIFLGLLMPLMDTTVEERQEAGDRETGNDTQQKGHPMQDSNQSQLQEEL